ncbi:DNA polymerase alpha subunit B [Galdieria sulphuraria]|uniref:DNA polymerase alpha subunit B n=1 Tax=Galdieria sulphuraria TaxID=130081 RepID=M2XST2_GALSU|nr:DNA polymerase alpha subunit B [Galdieria sulphuraria]EME26474.1 DNA polymerase alpha subunit B [Galdieria sulphuraria]GJD10002.1 DNA polymerase alpha subunit B [Galdieria sulphuraria]|eukprot:XP_005702994.1 DNA polymerase alpha subunit B [Galdieria sulphuraria]
MDKLFDFQRAVEAALRKRGYEDVLQNEQILQEIVKICSKHHITVEKLLLKHDLLWMNNLLPHDALTVDILNRLDAEFQQEKITNSSKENEFWAANFQTGYSAPRQLVSSLDDLFDVNWSNKPASSQLNGSFHGDIVSTEDSPSLQLDSPPFSPVRGTIKRQPKVPQVTTECELILEGDLDPTDSLSETRNTGEVIDEYVGKDYEKALDGSVRRMEDVELVCQTGSKFLNIRGEIENSTQLYEQHVEATCKMMLSKIQGSSQESINWPTSWDYLPNVDQKHLLAGYIRRIDKGPKGIQVIVDSTQSHLFSVDVSCIHSCSLFPGAIVLFEGTKLQDGSFQAERVYHTSHLHAADKKTEHYEVKHSINAITREMQILVASGPYTISTNLRYDPLKRLLNKVETKKPDLVILVGPFLDENHRVVENGPTEVSYEDIMAKRVGTLLERCFSRISTKCIMIPHVQDVFHHFTYPQKAYDSSVFFPLKKPDNIFFLNNPAAFRFGHVYISTTSIPVLDDLSSLSYIKTANQKGRITALCETLIDEESFYPIFPPPPQRPLDYSNVQQLKLDSSKTRLLIITSSLKPFTQRLKNDILCVNPGRLSKGVNNGSFALISHCFRELSSEKEKEQVSFSNSTTVKIVRN